MLAVLVMDMFVPRGGYKLVSCEAREIALTTVVGSAIFTSLFAF